MASQDRLRVDFGGAEVDLQVRRSRRARRIILSVDAQIGGISLILPHGVSVEDGLAFAREKAVWIQTRIAALPPRIPFVDGAVVPFFGRNHRIRHRPDMRGTAWCEGNEIHVAGQSEHLSRRLRDWLRSEAQRELAARAHRKAARIGRRVGRVTVRETRSRWGSCSENGNLSFCWRLIFAPEPVLDYVVAHEVAHLVEMNHSRSFWSIVGRITDDTREARTWLQRHGERLYRYG
ncbi:MAG: SprT family zinc-dependent metalloprotease [Alphaproteobacteria bacterium]|nr:SprT family zinc-dependent metalloprotease [Alphaproteobacteria bacterium]